MSVDMGKVDVGQHRCVWTVVQIEEVPVAVFCKICDATLPVGKEVVNESASAVHVPAGYFNPTAGYRYQINGGMNGVSHIATVEAIEWHSAYNGGTQMNVTFKLD